MCSSDLAARADAGGWKVFVKGEARSGKDGKTTTTLELAYDGATARSLRAKEKVMIERGVDSTEDLAVFFTGQGARHPVAWEMMGDAPFSKDASGATLEGTAQVAGEECDIVLVGGAAGGADAGNDSALETVTDGGTRLFIARSDRLPRKIERLKIIGAGETMKTVARVLTMGEFRKDGDVVPKPFAMNVPDGFRVRSPESGGGERKLTRGNQRERSGEPAKQERAPVANGLLAVGTDAPDWTLTDSNGVTQKLSEKRGKVVVMDFWATWCGPCKAAMPAVQRLHKKLGGDKVEVYGLSTWERGDAPGFMKKSGYTYGCLLNSDSVAGAYKVTGIPTFYVVGPDGKILWNAVGFSAAHEKEIEEVIREAVANAK